MASGHTEAAARLGDQAGAASPSLARPQPGRRCRAGPLPGRFPRTGTDPLRHLGPTRTVPDRRADYPLRAESPPMRPRLPGPRLPGPRDSTGSECPAGTDPLNRELAA